MNDSDNAQDLDWSRKGATLSDTTARKEYGLTQQEILQAVREGQLQCRVNSAHGNPFLRLLRHEVEALVESRHGADFLKSQRVRSEVAKIDKELRKLKAQIAELEERKSKLAGCEKPEAVSSSRVLDRG